MRMNYLFLDIETTRKIKLVIVLENLTQHQRRWQQVDLADRDKERHATIQFL